MMYMFMDSGTAWFDETEVKTKKDPETDVDITTTTLIRKEIPELIQFRTKTLGLFALHANITPSSTDPPKRKFAVDLIQKFYKISGVKGKLDIELGLGCSRDVILALLSKLEK